MKKFLPLSDPELVEGESKGFTLIELMVVVTIIAFLSIIGIVAFGNAQKQARDGRRRGDIDAIAIALEAQRIQLTGVYPAVAVGMFAKGELPKDPLADTDTISASCPPTNKNYCVATGTITFTVCATLEKANGNFDTNLAANTTNTGALYCRKSQQ